MLEKQSRSSVWQCSNKNVCYLPIFYNGCDLKWVSLLGVKPPTFSVDSLQSRGKQWHHPMGWSTAGRPYLIHAKALNKVFLLKSSYGQVLLLTSPVQQKQTIAMQRGFRKVIMSNETEVEPRSLNYSQQGRSLLHTSRQKSHLRIGWKRVVTSLIDGL